MFYGDRVSKTCAITFRVSPDVEAAITNAAKEHGLSRSDYIARTQEVHISNGMSCITNDQLKDIRRLIKEVGVIIK